MLENGQILYSLKYTVYGASVYKPRAPSTNLRIYKKW